MVDSQLSLINAATGKWTKDWFLCKILKGCSESHSNSDFHLVTDAYSSMYSLPSPKVEVDDSFILNMN